MDLRNQRGQILIESVFVILCLGSLLIFFQMMIDQQQKEIRAHRLSQSKKDVLYAPKNEDLETK